MGKIGRRKKKGRPPKSDLDRRHHLSPAPSPSPARTTTTRDADLRRSTRRRSLTYIDDFYDELFAEEEEEEEVEEEEEDDDDEDEELRRREKKLKSVLKIDNNSKQTRPGYKRVDSVSRTGGGRGRRVGHVSAPAPAPESSSGDDNKPFKKRKLEEEEEEEEEEEDEEEEDFSEQRNQDEDDRVDAVVDEDDVKSVRSRDQKKTSKSNGVVEKLESVQTKGKLSDSSKRIPLPDRQQLELILDKLQKKDTYGVYAEPVDPEELPDYHDVIEHPMDFGTIRKKLANAAYSSLEQFENDVDLICTNAMHYNAPETIYFKQARSIQELARKKFERLRTEFQNTVTELKSEETIKSVSIVKKPIKKSSSKMVQEPVGSDFSSGATLATAGDTCTLSNVTQAAGCEKPSTVDGQVDGNSSLTESKQEKTEEQLPGKGVPSKLWKKPFVLDENRRATYNISNQQVVGTESMCTVFEGEKLQLVSVGLNADHSYARSLARFAATLGPVAWRVASQRIEHALPSGIKFGRGWVGEYEPLPTPVLMLENQTAKQPGSDLPSDSAKNCRIMSMSTKDDRTVSKSAKDDRIASKSTQEDRIASKSTMDDRIVAGMKSGEHEPPPMLVQTIGNQVQRQQGKSSQVKTESRKERFAEGPKDFKNDMQLGLRTINTSGLAASCKLQEPAKEHHSTNPIPDGRLGFFGVSGSKPAINSSYQQQNFPSMSNGRSDDMVLKQVELHRSSSACGSPNGIAPQKQLEPDSEVKTSRFLEVVSRNRNLVQSVPFRQSETNGIATGRMPNGKSGSNSNNHQPSSLPCTVNSNQQARAAMYFPHGNHEQGLSDPVQMMRMLAEKNQNQQKSLNLAAMDCPQSIPDASVRRDDTSAAATAAARAWMTLGAAHSKPPDSSPKMPIASNSRYNTVREVPQSVLQKREEAFVSRVQLHGQNNKLPPQIFLPQHTHGGDESRFLNNRQMVFPQLVPTDLSRFQVQPPWQGLVPHNQPNKKHDSLPPDLNVSFQSPGSPPVRQSSGPMVDSQQPDLALQL